MFKQNKSFKNKSGVGLIEIIISISILSIGILGLLQAFPRGTKAMRALELETIANHLAQERIEEFAADSYDDIAVGILESQVRVESDTSSPFYRFKRSVVVGFVDEDLIVSAEDIGLKKINVTIEWQRPLDGADDSASLITLISEK